MKLTSKAFLPCEPGESDAAAVDAAGDAYVTPAALRPTLGYLALARVIAGKVRAVLRLDAAPTQGSIDVELRAGATVIGVQTVALSGITRADVAIPVDLAAANYATPLALALNVTAAADAGRTATLVGGVDVEVPLLEC